ncbi:DMT family transporter [Aminipila terrae]|uniref:EamA family transporter n=1 Tax=Aminipila terrae TaxID=2697030 RepID=A0A6P1ME82_9FIRM|nr:DMT family transporter [Aminipila terrae]QHI72999.1 EamA family transporter [Aminipila terrae]
MNDTKELFMQKTAVVWIGAMLCCALWGSAFPCIKIGYRLFCITTGDVGSQILFAGSRFTLAGILTIAIGSILNKKMLVPKRGSWLKILKLSMLQTVLQYIFFYIGLSNTTGVKASIIEGVNVFLAILIASLIFKQEKLTKVKSMGCIIGFIGVILVNLTKEGMDMSMKFSGEGFILLSTVAYAFSSVTLKHFSKDENPVVLSGYQFALGGIIMIVLGLMMNGRLDVITAPGIVMLLYLSVVSAVAYSLWGILLKYNQVSRVAVFGFMNPVFGVVLSALLLTTENEEALGLKSVISLILVCAGIYIVNCQKPSDKIDNSAAL